ncbi:MAG: hypothetical protein IPK82_11670 [Polyangiaceae bacterium]|nr:hypothetical protein [Polyangiaceae bacterium]
MIALTFRETMSGGYHLTTNPTADKPISFTIGVTLPSIAAFLSNILCSIEGMVTAEGLADHKHLKGTLHIDPFRARLLVYQFEFTDNSGRRLLLQGRKTLDRGGIVHAMTVLPAGIYDDRGNHIAQALLRFDLRSDLIKFLKSFKLTRA